MTKKGKGRRKVEMVKMSNQRNLAVTFSKRRTGLFKKASELSTLCGALVAIVVFSPGKKVFTFGHPSVEYVIDRLINGNPPQKPSGTLQRLIEAHRNAGVCELNMQLTKLNNELEAENKGGEELTRMRNASQARNWWEAPIDELHLPQLRELEASLAELKNHVAMQAENVRVRSSNQRHFFVRSSSSVGGIQHPFEESKNTPGFSVNMNRMPYAHCQARGFINPGFGMDFTESGVCLRC